MDMNNLQTTATDLKVMICMYLQIKFITRELLWHYVGGSDRRRCAPGARRGGLHTTVVVGVTAW